MIGGLLGVAQSGLLFIDPERAHEITLKALERGLYANAKPDDPRLAQSVLGLDFANPLGMAAGFDKDARVPAQLLALGFGFAEIGTVTPQPQPGNPTPRVFRLIRERAVINRLGFNSAGHAAALARLRRRPGGGIVGVNIGTNKGAADPVADYVQGLRAFVDVADYFTVNVSSPNTPGLRDLQAPERLGELLERVMAERDALAAAGHERRPVLVKLAPDLHDDDLPGVVAVLMASKIDGAVLTNTTISRQTIAQSAYRGEAGGLSGRPLFQRATRMLARIYRLTEGKLPLIGVGGIDSGEAALAKIRAGATLIQLYTGLIYAGPDLIADIKRRLISHMEGTGAPSLAGARGDQAEMWAQMPLD
jgi:dihydroorotate dehydrogenase